MNQLVWRLPLQRRDDDEELESERPHERLAIPQQRLSFVVVTKHDAPSVLVSGRCSDTVITRWLRHTLRLSIQVHLNFHCHQHIPQCWRAVYCAVSLVVRFFLNIDKGVRQYHSLVVLLPMDMGRAIRGTMDAAQSLDSRQPQDLYGRFLKPGHLCW